jgi:hypothetical protein
VLGLHLRPRDIEGLEKVHLIGNGPARDQRQANVLPVLVAGVFHQGPGLQGEHALLVEGQAIARFPNRVFHDITDSDRTLAVARKGEAHFLLLSIVPGGQHFEGAFEFRIEDKIEEPHALDLRQRHVLQSLRGEEIEMLQFDNLVPAGRLQLGFHAYDGPGEGFGGRARRGSKGYLNLLAAALVENLSECGVIGEIEGEAAEGLLNGIVAIVGDGPDVTAP